MQNFSLLEAVGRQPKAVMLKRGLSATIQEFLMAAEYILKQGNYKVVLCERGIRTFETMTRNTLDLGSIPLIKRLTHLPIIVDPSHGTGDRALRAGDGARRGGAGRGRSDGRGSPRAREGAVRRAAVAHARRLRGVDGIGARHRAGGGARACDMAKAREQIEATAAGGDAPTLRRARCPR